LGLASAAQNLQESALAKLILGWDDVRKMNASESHSSLTHAAASASRRAKDKILL
jgi:hypothetical protein